jgi:hypothetical protein
MAQLVDRIQLGNSLEVDLGPEQLIMINLLIDNICDAEVESSFPGKRCDRLLEIGVLAQRLSEMGGVFGPPRSVPRALFILLDVRGGVAQL